MGLGWTIWLLIFVLMVWEHGSVILYENNKIILVTEIIALTIIIILYLVYFCDRVCARDTGVPDV